jgi:hypothetical protein
LNELITAFWPAVLFGFAGLVIALIVGSIIFSESWVTAFLGILVFLTTAVPIAGDRLRKLTSQE